MLLNRTHFDEFIEAAKETGWPAARKPKLWARHVGAEQAFLSSLPEDGVSRDDLKRLCADSTVPPETCFIAIMAWGGMRYPAGTRAWNMRDRWAPLLERVRQGAFDRREGYARFRVFRAENAGCGFGPAFFTKLLFFGAPAHDAYIMDQWTGLSVNLLVSKGGAPIVDLQRQVINGKVSHSVTDRNDESVYEEFCRAVEFVFAQPDARTTLGATSAEDIEMRMFSVGGKKSGGWRNYVRSVAI